MTDDCRARDVVDFEKRQSITGHEKLRVRKSEMDFIVAKLRSAFSVNDNKRIESPAPS
jgi:hypothetical protein